MSWWAFNLISITLYSLQLVLAQRVLQDFSPLFMTIIRTFPFVILVTLFMGVVQTEMGKLWTAGWQTQVTVAAIVVANLVAMICMFSGIKAASAVHANIITMMSMVLVPLFTWVFIGKGDFNVYTFAAAGLVACGVLLLIFKG